MSEFHAVEDLLREFVRTRSEDAFGGLVERYRNLVFSTAVRQLNGDRHSAEDATQKVFADLARKASQLDPNSSLGGWLHCHTCFVCSDFRRSEQRRRKREHLAEAPHAQTSTHHSEWSDAESELDDAINELKETDRRVIIARFFEKQALKEIGEMFNVSDRAAHMRVSRAIERLREVLGKRGITVSSGALAVGLTESAAASSPSTTPTQAVATALAFPAGFSFWAWLGGAPLSVKLTLLAMMGIGMLMMRQANEAVVNQFGRAVHETESGTKSRSTAAIARLRSDSSGSGSSSSGVPNPISVPPRMVEFVDDRNGAPIPHFNFRFEYTVEGDHPVRDRRGGNFKADADGRWTIPSDAVPREVVSITTQTEGWANSEFEWNRLKGDEIPAVYVFRVSPGTPVGGLVLDHEGKPVAGAEVTMSRWSRDGKVREGPQPVGLCSTETDAEGRWSINSINERDLNGIGIHADHPNKFETEYKDTNDEATRSELLKGRLVLRFEPTVSISGRVIDDSGEPVAHGKVSAGESNHRPDDRELTDVDGSFTLNPVRTGWIGLAVEAKGFAAKTTLLKPTNDLSSLEIILNRGRKLRVQITDREHNPIPGAGLIHQPTSSSARILARKSAAFSDVTSWARFFGKADTDGWVVWPNAPHQEIYFSASADGYSTAYFRLGTNVQEHTIELPYATQVSGTVLDAASGDPLRRFRVWIGFDDGKNHMPIRWSRQRDGVGHFRNGRFELTTRVERYFSKIAPKSRIRVDAEGHEPFISEPFDSEDGLAKFDVRLRHANSHPITVMTPDNRLAVRADVALLDHPGRFVRLEGTSLYESTLAATERLLKTDKNGLFILPPGDEWIRIAIAHESGFAFVKPSQFISSETIGLKPWGRLEGIVDGRSSQNHVALHPDFPGWTYLATAKLDSSNRFVIPFAPPGKFKMRDAWTKDPFQPVTIESGQTNQIMLRLRNADGKQHK